jgi:hypothetical protein
MPGIRRVTFSRSPTVLSVILSGEGMKATQEIRSSLISKIRLSKGAAGFFEKLTVE